MKKVLVLALVALPFTSFARKPAVEPVTGISIDDYKDVPPSKAQGYDWNQQDRGKTRGKIEQAPIIKGDVTKLPQQEITTSSTPDLTPAVILMFMLVLPFGIWFFLLGKLEEPATEVGFDDLLDEEDNTLAFPSKAKSEDNDDDDDFDVPKAS